MTKKGKLKTAALVFAAVLIVTYAVTPSYVFRALIHWYPSIDDLELFAARPVKADNPTPWPISPEAASNSLPERYLPDFDRYQTVAFVVIKDNAIFFEQYWNGYNDSSLTNTFSMAKSVVAMLAGCALNDGYIKSLDQPVRDFVPEYPASNRFAPLTLRHLLTMSAGIDYDESYASLFSKTTEAYYGKNLLTSVVNMPQLKEPGEEFNYQSGSTLLLSIAISRAVGKPLADYFSEKIWTPIGAEHNAFWSLDHTDGLEKAYCCIYSNARDYARLGQLLNNKGQWGGEQIVSEQFIKEMVTPNPSQTQYFDGQPNKIYGYQLWLTNFRGYEVQALRGILGQYILAVPELNAVIVRLGKKADKQYTPNRFRTDVLVWLGAGFDLMGVGEK